MKRRQWLILGIGSLVVIVVLVLLLQRKDGDKPRPLPRLTHRTEKAPSVPPVSLPPTRQTASAPPPIERGKGVAVVASLRMVEQRAVEFSNLVSTIWSAELGTIFAAGDGAGDASIKVPTGMQVNAIQDALSRCAISLLLWDEDVSQDTIKAVKNYCETGGWLVFVSCPWIGSPPKSSPAELLGPRSFEGIAYVGAASQDRKAFALLKHPSLPELPVGERLRVYLQSSKALSGGEGRKIPLIRFEDPALRGITIQAMGHGGVVELNWDCPAGGRIGETDSQEFIKTVLTWLSGKDTWKEPAEQPGISLKVVARTPAGDPAPGAQIAVKVHTDWAKPLDQQVVTTDENGEAETPAKAPAIYTAWAAGEGYSSDNLALGRVAEGTPPEPLVVIVRPSVRIVGTAVYTGEQTGPASDVQVDLLPSSRARGLDVASVSTDKEGRFVFNEVPGGRPYLLRSETEEWAALEEIDLPESADDGTFEITLSLKKLAAIDGHVVEEGEEEKPIHGATVRIEPRWGIKALPLFLEYLRGRTALTNSSGEFKLAVLPDTTYGARAEADGYIWRETGSGRTSGWIEVRPPATVKLELHAGTIVRGAVYLAGDGPAPGAYVFLELARSRPRCQTTDLDGRFCFPCVELREPFPGAGWKNVTLWCHKDSFYGYIHTTAPVPQTEMDLVVVMEQQRPVRGIVTDPRGAPVSRAGVYEHGAAFPFTVTDNEGFFNAVHLFDLVVRKNGYESAEVRREALKKAAEEDEVLHVVLPRSDGVISGRVVMHDGSPLRNETVDFRVVEPTSDFWDNVILGQQGDFVLQGVRTERSGRDGSEDPIIKTVDLEVDWYPDRTSPDVRLSALATNVSIGDSDVLVRFGPTGEIRGRFVNGQDASLIPDVSVFAPMSHYLRRSMSGPSGEFTVPWIVPAQYTVMATCPGFFPWRKEVDVGAGRNDVGDVLLYQTLIVQGQAVSRGAPVEGAEVRVTAGWAVPSDRESVECGQGSTDAAGRFRITFSNPFDSRDPGSILTYGMSVKIGRDRGEMSRQFSAADASHSGVVDVGQIEL